MRGHGESNGSLWYSLDLEELVERDHPLRAIKRMVDDALRGMDADFRRAYSRNGRPSVAPERLLKALLLQALYTIRSERELCRRLRIDLLFRWFLDMTPDEDVFVPTVFTHNRERLAEHGLTRRFFDGVVRQAIAAGLASDDHFAVDGSLIQSHASIKSLKRIAREGEKDHGGDARRRARVRQRNAGYWRSQRRRKIVEEFFGWSKMVGGLRRSRHVGRWKIAQQVALTAAAYNLVRMRRLLAA